MRRTTSRLGCDRTSRARKILRRFPGAAVVAALSSAGFSSLFAAPSVAAPKPVPRRSNTAVAQAAPAHHRPDMAVVYDDTYRPPARDLQLALDGERRADAAAHYVSGVLQEDKDPDGANAQYLKSLALDPGNAELSVKLAQDYLRRGDVPAAINLLKDTIKAAPKLAKPYLALGYIYYSQQNKADLAQKYISQALDLDPTEIRGYDYLRTIYRETNQTDKIPALLDRAAKVDTGKAEFWLYLGKLFIEQYFTTESSLAGEPLKKTNEVFQKTFVNGKDDADVIAKVGDYYVATKQFKEAIPVYQRVLELDPGPGTVVVRENLARCYVTVDQQDKAAETLEVLLKINPADGHAYETLAKLYEKLDQPDKAIANYEQSLLVNPNYLEGYENVTDLLIRRNQPERAVPLLAEARKRFPGQPGFSFLLAVTFERAKQHQQALTIFEQTELEAQSAQPALLDSRFYFEFGMSAEQAGLYDRAGLLLKKSLGMEDDNRRIALISNYLGYMWVDHSMNLEEGGSLIKRALEIDPENGAYLDSLGWYYYRTNQFEQASVELAKAVQATQPEDAAVYEHLGDTFLKLNETEKAVAAWQKAVDLDATNPNLPVLTKKITDAKAAPAPAPPPKG